MNSDSAIFCFGKENMSSYEENKKAQRRRKKKFCTIFALCAKTAQDYLRKLRLASFIKRKVLRCTATKTTLVCPMALRDLEIAFNNPFVFLCRLSVFLLVTSCRSSIVNFDSFSPNETPFTVDLHVITPVMYDISLLYM